MLTGHVVALHFVVAAADKMDPLSHRRGLVGGTETLAGAFHLSGGVATFEETTLAGLEPAIIGKGTNALSIGPQGQLAKLNPMTPARRKPPLIK